MTHKHTRHMSGAGLRGKQHLRDGSGGTGFLTVGRYLKLSSLCWCTKLTLLVCSITEGLYDVILTSARCAFFFTVTGSADIFLRETDSSAKAHLASSLSLKFCLGVTATMENWRLSGTETLMDSPGKTVVLLACILKMEEMVESGS